MEEPIFDSCLAWSEMYSVICYDCAEKYNVCEFDIRGSVRGFKICGVCGCSNRARYEILIDDYDVED